MSSTVADDRLVRVNAPQTFWRGFVPAVRDIWQYRELLLNLVRKELKVKYKDSVLGFVWSLARPMFLLGIYYVVFSIILKNGFPNFAFYLFAGLIAWDLFGTTLGAATTSIVANAGLIKKVYFPREIFPLATIGAGLFNFMLQLIVLIGALAVARYHYWGHNLLLFPVAVVTLVLFMTACCLFLAAANVYLRDTQHLLEVFLLFWFWMNPIVYPINQALYNGNNQARHLLGMPLTTLYFLNPMTDIIICFQRVFYQHLVVTVHSNGAPPQQLQTLYHAGDKSYLAHCGVVLVISIALVFLAQRFFARAQGNFAQEL